ncbi:MAG: GldG family protein [Treponema sp.]|nr:GldG family protein [Treponema sp.]
MQTKKLIHLTAICAVFFLVLLLCFINSINGRIDFSKDKVFTLSDYSKNLLSNVSEKVQITYYVSDKLSSLYPEARDVKDFLIEYTSKSKLVSVSIQDPQKTGLEQKLLSLGIEAQQIQTSTATETSFVSVYSAIVLEYRGKIEMIPFVVSTAGLEFELTSMLQFLIDNITRKVQILVGNDFTLDNDYIYLVPWLESAGFLCTQVFQTELAKLDYSIPLLVLGSKNLKADDIFEIENFIMQGGNAAFCVSKNNVNIYTDWTAQPDTNTLLTDLLDYWGISIQNQLVLDIINYRIEMQSDKQDSRNEYINYPFWIVTGRHSLNFENILSFGYSGLETYWANPIELFEDSNLNKITPILKTSTKASLMSEPFDTDPFRNKTRIFEDKAQYILAATLQGKVKGYYTTAESPNVKIFVLADQYAPSRMIEYTNSPHNMDFFVSVLLWLSNEDNLLQIKNKGIRSTSLESISNIEGVFSALKMTIFL